MKKCVSILLVALMMTACFSVIAEELIEPYRADEVFATVGIYVSGTNVGIAAEAIKSVSYIKVTSVWLEKKSGNSWTRVQSLTCPSVTSYTMTYEGFTTLPSNLSSGTYRIGITIDGGGHVITRYSAAFTK